jgi:HPt (histidine-containing phosphotransfer) domain-containing protein
LEYLRSLFADDPEMLRGLIDEAVENSASLLGRLRSLSAERSNDAVKVLHELKGLTKTVGAEELGSLSERAENAARAGRWDDVSADIDALEAAHTRLVQRAASLGDDISGSE